MLKGRGPEYLLRLPAEGEQAELYVDVLANGRLRGPWDLAAFANEDLGLGKADKDALKRQFNEYVVEVAPGPFCTRLVTELADACEAADNLAEAAFWQIQIDVLEKQIELAEEELAEERRRGEEQEG